MFANIEVDFSAFIVIIVFVLTYFLFIRRNRLQNLPPGPKPYPLIGNFLELTGKDLRQLIKTYRERYGDIFAVRNFSQVVIVVSGYENLKDLFIKHGSLFSERPKLSHIGPKSVFKGEGIANASGDLWKNNRRFAIHTLKDFGMGKTKLQTKIHEEIQHFLDEIEKHHGQPFNIKELIHIAISNVICSLLFGKRYDYDDNEFRDYLSRLEQMMKAIVVLQPKWFKHIPGDPLGVAGTYENFEYAVAFYRAKIREHYEDFDENNIRDIIDAYILELRKAEIKREPSLFHEDELIRLVHDLFLAGSDTTATAITFGLVYLLRDTGIQTKLYEEIRDAVGEDRLVDVSDKSNLPLMEASVSEILRRSSIAPFSLPHVTKGDVQYRGFTIPKTAIVYANLESVQFDDAWEDADSFNPYRFLDEDMNIKTPHHLIPFSLGPRICPGEGMARMEMYLFLSAVLQRFEILPPEGEDPPSLETIYGPVVSPKPFKVRAMRRVI